MKRFAGIALVSAVTLLAACSSSDEGSPGAGGKSGSAGAGAKAGAAGKAGASSKAGSGGEAGVDDTQSAAGEAGTAGEGDLAGAAGQGPDTDALYAVSVLVFNPDNTSTTYVDLFDKLDVPSVSNDSGREFANQADIAAYGGYLFVSSGEAPTITQYTVSNDGSWQEGPTISFANYGLVSAPVRDSVNTFISPTKAYLADPLGGQFIWNPTTMEILGHIEVPDMTRDGMMLDGSSGIVRGNRLYRTFYWEDWSTYTFSDEQYLVTFDLDEDKLLSTTPLNDCPNLGAPAFSDESGVIYFSNWFYNVPGTLIHDKPKSCAVRILPGKDSVDPDWKLSFSDVTGGHEGAQLSYIGKGEAVFAMYHEEAITITPDMDPSSIPNDPNWEVWKVDLNSLAASRATGIERGIAAQSVFMIDGQAFLFAPTPSYDASQAYLLKSGRASKSFSIEGYTRGFIKIR